MGFFGNAILIAFAIGSAAAWQDPDTCGQSQLPFTNIVGGVAAEPGEYPWMAAMIINKGRFGCGGTLIDPEWVVTAAHCLPIKNLPMAYDFVLGQAYLNSTLSPEGQFIEVAEIYVHPNYTYKNQYEIDRDYDIALMKMSEPFVLTDYVQSVCVPPASFDSFFMPGISSTVTGWGSNRQGGDPSEFLMEVDVPIFDQDACKAEYDPIPITDNMICAGVGKDGLGVCEGDSGGPLISKISDKWYMAGVVSFGAGCESGDPPGVYTRVTAFEDWITPVYDGGEIEVDNDCDYNEFMCTDGWCTDYKHKCNGLFDGCFLGSDDNFCDGPTKFFDHMFQVMLTPSSIVESDLASSENECAQRCMDAANLCLAFDAYYNDTDVYMCHLAGSTFETKETDDFFNTNFQIEKFPLPSMTEPITYIPGRFATPRWIPTYNNVDATGHVWIIQPEIDEMTEPFNSIRINFVVNVNGGPSECSDESTVNAVSIRMGTEFTSPSVGQYCLNVLPSTIVVPGQVARVEFLTADYTQFGFVAEYSGNIDCDQEFTTSPGAITTPNYPSNYPDDTTCKTLMTAEDDQAVLLVFTDFALEIDPSPDCANGYDTLKIYDSDHADENRLIATFCGNNYETTVRSTGPNMYLVFQSDRSVSSRGFSSTFSFIPNIPCDRTYTVGPGLMSSPNYPENYPSNSICRNHIMAPEGINIRVTINDFQLEENDDCAWDFLSIYDSNTNDDETLVGTYCGTDLAPGAVFESTGQDMLFLFTSDGSFNDKGYQALFEFVPANETGCDAAYTEPASFSSPNYPSYYPNNALCQTKITAPADQIVFLSILDFDLEDDYSNCQEDYDTLSVYDSDFPDPSRLIGKYCGTAIPTYFTSTGSNMFVVFKSDVSNARSGFSASFKFETEIEPPVSPPPPINGSECGRQRAPLLPEVNVVGGQAAQEGEWPWQGALRIMNDQFVCGVSLLTADWVITAAHCVDILNEPGSYNVMMGSNSLLTPSPNTQFGVVADIFINPNFIKFNNDYDVALLKMASPFTLTDYVHPVCIPPSEWNYYVQGGVESTVTGWGATFSGGIPIQTLYEVELPLYDQDACVENYAPEPVTDNMVCAGYPWGGKDSCTGDDGGPLVVAIGGQWYLVGVVSWRESCGQERKPGVYSRITMLEDWIAPIFEGNDPERDEIGVCNENEFQCSDGWCIDYVYKCDNDENSDGPGCSSGSDEAFCDSSTVYFDPSHSHQLRSDSIRRTVSVNTPDECADLCLQETSEVCFQFDISGVGPVQCRLGREPYNLEDATITGLTHFEMQNTPASGSVLTVVNGRISSPRFSPSSISTKAAADYDWTVNPGSPEMTGLTTTSYTFGQVHSDSSDSCGIDFTTGSYVTIRSGPDGDSPEAEKICLNAIDDDYTALIPSTMSRLELHVSDEDMYGFVADYKVFWSCDATYDQAPTVISSPNYPENYPNDVTCRTLITAPADFQVLLYLRDIQFESGGQDCRFDWDHLTIYDSDMEENQIAKYCDNNYETPLSLRSSGSNMLLVFKSDAAVAMPGYEGAFYFVPAETTTPPPRNDSDACGIQTAVLEPEMFIVGGKPAQEGEWPWQAALYWYNTFICGGVLLTPEWIITIASCVPEPSPEIFDVVLGTNSLEDLSDNRQFRGVSEIVIHPQFDFFSYDFDVALLRLSEPAVITDHVRTVCLPSASMMFPADTVCTATGFGEESQTGPNTDVLYEVQVPVIDQDVCETLYDPTPITGNMICAGDLNGGNGVCRDDAGGPLVSLYQGQYYLVGVPSFARGCAEENFPAIYMRMTVFEDWINNVIDGNYTEGVYCDQTFNQAPGEFSSPFYPENYPNNVTCRTLLTAGEGERVYLSMRDFRLESNVGCQNDFDTFTVYDSNTDDPSQRLGIFCGTDIPDYFLSSGRSLYVVFKSDLSVTEKGFDAAFYFIPESGCNNVITEAPGMISSPFYPDEYPNNVECTTQLIAPEGQTVILQFRDFVLEEDLTQCDQELDTLSIYDGEEPNEENLMGVYCGSNIPERFDSTGEHMVLVFKTDEKSTFKGYEAAYYFIPPTSEPVTPSIAPPPNQPECGTQTLPLDPEIKIIGGQEAQIGEYPWQAAVYTNNGFICGGTLVADRWVVTTASCVTPHQGNKLSIRVGTNVRDGAPDTIQTKDVSGTFYNPAFNSDTHDNDVVLLKTNSMFQINDYVRTACVPPADMDSSFMTGKMCMATGWGSRFEGGPYVNELHEVDLSVQDQSFCTQHYFPEVVTENMLCAGPLEGGKGVCEGDYGGPLVARVGNYWYLVGMSSWGKGCAMQFFPSIFTRMTAVSEWIAPIFSGQDPDTSPVTPDPLPGLEKELKDLKEQSDVYMKAMFGLVGGVVLALLILLYVAYSYGQQNDQLKSKLDYMQDDSGDEAGGIRMTLPATSSNVYEMNAPRGEGGVVNEAAEVGVDETDSTPKAEEASDTPKAAAAAKPVEKQDMATENPEFIKYPKE